MMTEYLLWVKQCHKPPGIPGMFYFIPLDHLFFLGDSLYGIVLPTLISMLPLISIDIQWWMGFFWDWLTTGLWHCVTHMIGFLWISGFLSVTSLRNSQRKHWWSCPMWAQPTIISHLNSCIWWFYYKTIGKWWFNYYLWWFYGDFMVV